MSEDHANLITLLSSELETIRDDYATRSEQAMAQLTDRVLARAQAHNQADESNKAVRASLQDSSGLAYHILSSMNTFAQQI